jgi:hypothetical protein
MLLSFVAEGCRPKASVPTFFTNRVICYNLWFQSTLDPLMFLAVQILISPTHQIHTGIHCPHSTSTVSEAADFHTRSYSADHGPHCITCLRLVLCSSPYHLSTYTPTCLPMPHSVLLTRLHVLPPALPYLSVSFTISRSAVSSTKHSKHLKRRKLRILYSIVIQSVLLVQTL